MNAYERIFQSLEVAVLILLLTVVLNFILFNAKEVEAEDKMNTWILTTDSFVDYTRVYLGNGYISTQVPIEGNGWAGFKPVNCYIAGVYNQSDPKRVTHTAIVPRWSALIYDNGYHKFSVDSGGTIKPYRQELDLRDGYIRTTCTWEDRDRVTDLDITIFVSRDDAHRAVIKYSLVPRFTGTVRIINVLDGSASPDLEAIESGSDAEGQLIWLETETGESQIDIVEASILASSSGVKFEDVEYEADKSGKITWQRISFPVVADEKYTFYKYVSVYTSLDSRDPLEEARESVLVSADIGYEACFEKHRAAWHNIWETDIEIEGDTELQKMIHSQIFFLLNSIRAGWDWSIAPMGISSSGFNGHIFWDAETWMYPPLLLMHPELAESMLRYRYNTLSGAQQKAKENGYEGAMFAWESASTGVETTPKWADTGEYEHHITGDVALAQWQYYLVTLDKEWLERYGYPIIYETAKYWVSRVIYNSEADRYEVRGVICADEYSGVVDNNVFTNAVAQRNLYIAIEVCKLLDKPYPNEWKTIADKMFFPFDKVGQKYLEFEDYAGQRIKQADTNLLTYPLEFPMSEDVKANDLDYYTKVFDVNGPAMSSSIYSIVSAELGRREGAYEYYVRSYKPNVKLPFYAFSETPINNNFCFLTGIGGSLQSLIYGFTGLRIHKKGLAFTPFLPEEWDQLKLKNFKFRGASYDIVVKKGDGGSFTKSCDNLALSLEADDYRLTPRGKLHLILSLANEGDTALREGKFELRLPEGWEIERAQNSEFKELKAGDTISADFEIAVGEEIEGDFSYIAGLLLCQREGKRIEDEIGFEVRIEK